MKRIHYDERCARIDAFAAGKHIDVTVVSTQYHLEILQVCAVLPSRNIIRYTTVTRCAFAMVQGEMLLALDLRDDAARHAPEDQQSGALLIVLETLRGDKILPLAVIVDEEGELFNRLY
jgi:hypothetical protein